MNRERLIKIRDFVQKLPPENLNMESFITKSDGDCGTVCCVIGWFPKLFPDDWKWDKDLRPNYKDYIALFHKENSKFVMVFGLHPAQEFLGLSYNDTEWLFDEYEYDDLSDPEEVVDRINTILSRS